MTLGNIGPETRELGSSGRRLMIKRLQVQILLWILDGLFSHFYVEVHSCLKRPKIGGKGAGDGQIIRYWT